MSDTSNSPLDVMDRMAFRLECPEDGARLLMARTDVAELLEADEEYDAAEAAFYELGSGMQDKYADALDRAKLRRAAAILAMRTSA